MHSLGVSGFQPGFEKSPAKEVAAVSPKPRRAANDRWGNGSFEKVATDARNLRSKSKAPGRRRAGGVIAPRPKVPSTLWADSTQSLGRSLGSTGALGDRAQGSREQGPTVKHQPRTPLSRLPSSQRGVSAGTTFLLPAARSCVRRTSAARRVRAGSRPTSRTPVGPRSTVPGAPRAPARAARLASPRPNLTLTSATQRPPQHLASAQVAPAAAAPQRQLREAVAHASLLRDARILRLLEDAPHVAGPGRPRPPP